MWIFKVPQEKWIKSKSCLGVSGLKQPFFFFLLQHRGVPNSAKAVYESICSYTWKYKCMDSILIGIYVVVFHYCELHSLTYKKDSY